MARRSPKISFLVLNHVMRRDYREIMVRHVLNHRPGAAPASRQQLERALRDSVMVKGFRDSTKAPTEVLLKETVHQSYHSNKLLGAILQVWVDRQPGLQGHKEGDCPRWTSQPGRTDLLIGGCIRRCRKLQRSS